MATKPPSKDSKPDAKAPAKTDPKAQGKGSADTEGDEAAAPKKRGKMLIVVAALLLLGGGGGAAWYLLKPAPGKGEALAAAKPAPSKPPVFLPLEAFTVNLMHDDASPQYLQVGLSLKMTDPAMVDAVKQRMPEVRNRILLLLSSKKASDISSPQGKEALSTELMQEIGKPLGAAAPSVAGAASAPGATLASSSGIESVLFTSFVIQ